MQWNLDQLHQFIATVESGSMSAAARRLGKAQSAVSTAIGLLEADLGVTLFDRTQHRATLTDAGRVLLLEARELLRQARALDQRAQSLATGDEPRLALALDEALPYTAIRTLLRELSDRFPSLELTLLNGTATEVADYVGQSRADAAFQFDRGPLRDGFDQRRIGTLAQGIFAASGHPLTEKPVVRREELARYRQIVMRAEDIEEMIYSPKIWRSDSFYTIAEMVADDLGWAALPINVAADHGYPKPLRQISCPSLALPLFSIRMIWPQGREPGTAACWAGARFAELMRAWA